MKTILVLFLVTFLSTSTLAKVQLLPTTKVIVSDLYSQFFADFDELFTNLVFNGNTSSQSIAAFTALFNEYMVPNVHFSFPFGGQDFTGIDALAQYAVSLQQSGIDTGEFHSIGLPHFSGTDLQPIITANDLEVTTSEQSVLLMFAGQKIFKYQLSFSGNAFEYLITDITFKVRSEFVLPVTYSWLKW